MAVASRFAPLAAVMLLAGTSAVAQVPGPRQTREFVQAAAQSDEFERMEATTALAQSKNPHIRAFAQQMLDAHRATTDRLLGAVAQSNLKPPAPGIGGDQSMFLAALQSARGADFDKLYVRQQVLAHRAALATQQGYAASGDDAAIRSVAAATVPIVAAHLQMAERMQAAMGGN